MVADAGVALAAGRRVVARTAAILEQRYLIVLAALVVVNWAIVAREALSSIPHNGWLYYHGGDATWYWTIAHTLTSLHLPETLVGYGASLMQAPVAAVVGPNMLAGLPAIVLFNVVVLGPLAMLALFGVADRIAGRLFGLWTVLLWVAVPPVVIHIYRASNRGTFVDAFMPMARGLNGLADYPSMVCVLVCAYLLLRTLDTRAWTDAAAAGVVVGFLIGLKPSNALFLPAATILVLALRRLEPIGAFVAGLAPAVVTLAIFKHTGLGTIPAFSLGATHEAAGQIVAVAPWNKYIHLNWSHLKDNKDALREVLGSVRILELVLVGGTVALALRAWLKAAFVCVWFLAYFIVKGTSLVTDVYATSFFRLLEPAYPAFLLLGASLVLAVPTGREWRRRRHAARARADTVPLGRRALVAIAVVFAVLPLAAIAAARPIPRGTVAYDYTQGLEVPVVDMGFTATPQRGAVALRWHDESASGARAWYRIYRDRTDGCTYPGAGAPQCQFAMKPLRTVEGTSFVDYGVHGALTYRVALVSDWTRSNQTTDVLLLSKALRVTAR